MRHCGNASEVFRRCVKAREWRPRGGTWQLPDNGIKQWLISLSAKAIPSLSTSTI